MSALWYGAWLAVTAAWCAPAHSQAAPPPAATDGLEEIEVNEAAGMLAPLLQQLASGRLSVQQAWDGKLLDVDALLYLFSQHIDAWGGFGGKIDAGLRQSLMALLVRHGGERLQDPSKLTPKVRLWLGDYYQASKDARAVPVLESVLAELQDKSKNKGREPLVFQTVERLAWHYRDAGQLEKAAETWLRLEQLLPEPNWMMADASVEAARLYTQMGDEKKADELYSKVPQYGQAWFTGVALFDQVSQSINQGKHEKARKLLFQSVTGDVTPIKASLFSLLSKSYYCTGEWDKARKYSEEAIERFNRLENSARNEELKAEVNMVQARLRWSEQWLVSPILCEPRELHVPLHQVNKPIMKRLSIRMFRAAPLTVVSNDPKVKVQLLDKEQDSEYFVEKEILVEVSPEPHQKDFNALLTITSPQFPAAQVQVPISAQVHHPIHLSEQTVFFGFVKAGDIVLKSLKLSATSPFRIIKVETDDKSVQARSDIAHFATEHSVKMTL